MFYKELSLLIPIFLSLILCGILGLQRALSGKNAGPRTYALVGAGSTLFTLLSFQAFAGDPARIAAGIVTGIGFLGAGTVIHKKENVEGLTTAASLWMSAAIGMAVGLGYYVLSTIITLVVLLLLVLDDRRLRRL